MKLYHGSFEGNIKQMLPISKFHDDPTKKVVYLTASLPYALFYIWDPIHNELSTKHVTAYILRKNNLVCYEEQMPDQLYKFYNGVSGFVYCFDNLDAIKAKEPQMYAIEKECKPLKVLFIKNVYQEIIKYEKLGLVRIDRYNDLSNEDKQKIDEKMCTSILMHNYLNEVSEKAHFYKKNFTKAWTMAQKKQK